MSIVVIYLKSGRKLGPFRCSDFKANIGAQRSTISWEIHTSADYPKKLLDLNLDEVAAVEYEDEVTS